jgi:hypothetical protein
LRFCGWETWKLEQVRFRTLGAVVKNEAKSGHFASPWKANAAPFNTFLELTWISLWVIDFGHGCDVPETASAAQRLTQVAVSSAPSALPP